MAEVMTTIEQQIRRERQALNTNLRELQERAQVAVDWRTHYRAHVGAALAVAIGGGVLLGTLTRGRRHGGRSMSAVSTPTTHATRAKAQVHDWLGVVASALIGVASTAAVGFVSELIPGFEQEFESRRRS